MIRTATRRMRPCARRLLVAAGAVVLALAAAVPALALTGDEIIRRMERHERHDSMQSTGSMEITDRFGTRTKSFMSTALGDDRSLLEFTNPEEAGQKVLRLEDEIYLYFPDSEDVIHLQGAALRDSVLGSDFSYEDMTGSSSRLNDYEVVLEGTEEIDGHETYRLRLTAKRRDVVYPVQVAWVDSERFVTRRVELFSRRGRALKRMAVTEFREVGDKVIGTRLEMSDFMKKESMTVFTIDDIAIDEPVDESLFSLEELTF
ncbi:MAG: outer membrane lipoprotein-sorting protein [Spirochaetaceae bacterium]|nr:outer membrane lipoprotein-sorting protein [Spirochaetaceae bacterium]